MLEWLPGAGGPNWTEVALSVYTLTGAGAINLVTSAAGVGGAYHVGVEVYGLEWSFGGSDLGTGIYMVHPQKSSLGTLYQRVPLGKTTKSPEEVLEMLAEYRRTWRGAQYHLLAKNCASFSLGFSELLVPNSSPPEWINAFADWGKGVTGAEADATQLAIEEEDLNLDEFDDDQLEEFAEDGDHIAMLELVWRRGKEYTLEWVQQQQHNAEYEDLIVEIRLIIPPDDNGKLRSTAVGLMRDPRLRKAIEESTAIALGLQSADDWDYCPIQICKFATLPNLRISTTCRATGGEHIKRLKRKPTSEEFSARFKKSMKIAAYWEKKQQVIIDTMLVDTTPGQPALHERALTRFATRDVIRFPRKDFKPPTTSVYGNLGKLQELRLAVQEQSNTNRTLKVIMATKPCTPWWAS